MGLHVPHPAQNGHTVVPANKANGPAGCAPYTLTGKPEKNAQNRLQRPRSLRWQLWFLNWVQRPRSLALTPAMPQFSLGTS